MAMSMLSIFFPDREGVVLFFFTLKLLKLLPRRNKYADVFYLDSIIVKKKIFFLPFGCKECKISLLYTKSKFI